MSKIIGDEKLIKRVKNARPGDKSVYITWDALEELGDEFEAVITDVKFDPSNLKSCFSNVNTDYSPSWMPNPDLMYRIAEARGIRGGDVSITEAIYEKVNYSELTLDPIPQFIEILVGYSCKKISKVTEEDGTDRPSDVCTIEYNAWNRCSEAWAKEEKAMEGYTLLVNGEYEIKEYGKKVKKNGLHMMKPGQYGAYAVEAKYNTKWARSVHFKSELKFAQPKAETKAHLKTIRVLANLMTGYSTKDLESGSLVFAKIRRSRKLMRMETAAHLARISGGTAQIEAPAVELYGEQRDVTPSVEPEPAVTPDTPLDQREQFINDLTAYLNSDNPVEAETATNMLNWIKSSYDESNGELITKIKAFIAKI